MRRATAAKLALYLVVLVGLLASIALVAAYASRELADRRPRYVVGGQQTPDRRAQWLVVAACADQPTSASDVGSCDLKTIAAVAVDEATFAAYDWGAQYP